MVAAPVHRLEADTSAASWDILPRLRDDLRIHAGNDNVNVRVGHALGFYDHHGLERDPALFAEFPQVPQKNGLVLQDLLERTVLDVVV